MSRVYLDWNATAPMREEARAAMLAAMESVGNPSSVHAEGRAAKAIIERARGAVAALVGAAPSEVILTSGATEAVALAVPDMATVATSAVEHDAVHAWNSAGDGDIFLDVDADGRMQPTLNGQPFDAALWDDLVAVQAANSETGVLQDLPPLIAALRGAGREALVLVDLAQWAGKLPCDFAALGADFGVLSGHKFGAPPGVGALILRPGLEVTARLRGGGQEMGRRSGTENVIGIAGFGAAAAAAQRDIAAGLWDRVAKLRTILEEGVEAHAPEAIFVGKGAPRLPNTSCIITPGWKGETQVMAMDLAGFAISAGSACSSGKVKESRVLRAMGYDEVEARSAIRVSLGPSTTEDEVRAFIAAWGEQFRRWRSRAA